MLTLDEIRLYPVKGLHGVSVREAMVEPWGLKGDRRWMVVDAAGRFLTQRQHPAMAVIRAELIAGGLRLSTGGRPPIKVPEPSAESSTMTVTVWDDEVPARLAKPAADTWLSTALGTPCRLVHMDDPAAARPVDPVFGAPEDRVSFADGFPLLVTTSASLDDLNRRLSGTVGMDRFRANLVLGGGSAWAEDAWAALRVGGIEFAAVKDCARCAVPTVDQETGIKAPDNEPTRTLGTFRRKADGRIIFGQNLVPRGLGRIAVGDPVEGRRPVV